MTDVNEPRRRVRRRSTRPKRYLTRRQRTLIAIALCAVAFIAVLAVVDILFLNNGLTVSG